MKLSVAAIFLSQSLPTWSEVPVRAEHSLAGILHQTLASNEIFHAARNKRLAAAQRSPVFHMTGLTNGPRILRSSVYCDPSSTDPDTGILSCGEDRVCQASLGSQFGGICVLKTSERDRNSAGKVFMPKFTKNGRLVNHNVAAHQGPCDPTASVDIGILACGQGKVCQVDETSDLGGICSHASATSRRLDTVGVCDETSPDFISSCDCTGLDNATGTGVVDCLLYDNYTVSGFSSACEGITMAISIAYTFEESVATSYTACYATKTPSYQKACYTYLASDGSCSLTFDGQQCTTCDNGNSTYYECRNVEGGAGKYLLQVIPALNSCLYPFSGNGSNSYNCTQLCSEGDYMAYANYNISVTIPGVGEMPCGYLAVAELFALIADEVCPLFSKAAQSSCCEYHCDLCGPTAYVPLENSDKQLNLTVPGYEGLTCGSVAYAAYSNFSIPDGTCDSTARLIQPTCCKEIPSGCSLCGGPLTNPDVNVTIEGYSVQCADLQSLLSSVECANVSKEVSSVCCSGSSSAPVETPTAAPGESGGDSPSGSGGQERSDATRGNLIRGGLASSVVGVMIATAILVASI